MAARKKSKASGNIVDTAPVLGDSVTIVSATIFDNAGNLSDLLASGKISKINPEPGWDYEVTFDGVLSLDGREPMKSRLYNKHQIIKDAKFSIPSKASTCLYEAINEEFSAVREYNYFVEDIRDVCKQIAGCTLPDKLQALYLRRNRLMKSISEKSDLVKKARAALAAVILQLLDENSYDKTLGNKEN